MFTGENSMLTPPAYRYTEEDEENIEIQKLQRILGSLQTSYCSNCEVGIASKILNYNSLGNCLDYAFDVVKIPYRLFKYI